MEPSQDPTDAAYMSLLNRVIPGVGNMPLTTKPTTKPKPAHITSMSTSTSPSSLTTTQRQAIKTLEGALENALFVSEGEEPYAAVHIVPTTSFTASTTHPALPSAPELRQILKDTGITDDLDQGDDAEDEDDATCERTMDLKVILAPKNPGHEDIAKALRSIFGYDSTSTSHSVALYRISSPASPTRVHLWVLGWVDHHLVGLHTISIES
ncbi:hypothetical protein BG005_007153 [Podila minutissima]|nr:hypothetical protein BG005_007153 [Podila minutissima]